MKTNIFPWHPELNFIYKWAGGNRVIRMIIFGTVFILISTQILKAQDEFPKLPGLHSQQGIDLIPEPQIVNITGGDFPVNSATLIYADPQLQDLTPVTSLQEGLAEILQIQIKKTDSRPATNGIVLKLVPESGLPEVPVGNPGKEGYRLEVTPKQITIEAAYPAGLFYGVQTLLQLAEQGRGTCPGTTNSGLARYGVSGHSC